MHVFETTMHVSRLFSPKVMTMSEGEESRFFIAPDLAYGDLVACAVLLLLLLLLLLFFVVSLTLTYLLTCCLDFFFNSTLFRVYHLFAKDSSPWVFL